VIVMIPPHRTGWEAAMSLMKARRNIVGIAFAAALFIVAACLVV